MLADHLFHHDAAVEDLLEEFRVAADSSEFQEAEGRLETGIDIIPRRADRGEQARASDVDPGHRERENHRHEGECRDDRGDQPRRRQRTSIADRTSWLSDGSFRTRSIRSFP